MPRGAAIAPPAEQHLTLDNIIKDFAQGKARVYKGIPAIRVWAKEAKNLPVADYPYYEHPNYGDDVYSFITYTGMETFLIKNQGERVEGPVHKTSNAPVHRTRVYEWEHVFVDMFLTPHEKRAFDIGDPHNTSNLFRSVDFAISTQTPDGEPVSYRGGIHDTIRKVGYEPVTVDHGVRTVDVWPSGQMRGKYLADMTVEFLEDAVRRGEKASDANMQNLSAIAGAELNRRGNLEKEKKGDKK